MNLRGFQIKTAVIVFVAVLALGLGLQYLHQATQVLIPLTKELEAVSGVESVRLVRGSWSNRSRTLVKLKMDGEVPLSVSIGQAQQILGNLGGTYAIELEDSATVKLNEIFQKVQVVAEEAIMTGEFSLLETRVQALAEAEGLSWELGVDRNFVYLRLRDSTHALQRVIPRDNDADRLTISTKGVETHG